MPFFLLILLVGYLVLFPSQTSRNPLAIHDFLQRTSLQVKVTSLVKHQKCYESFTMQPLDQFYFLQASWFSCQALSVDVGDVLNVVIVLKPLHSSNSPGAFDTVQWARQNNIIAQATIISAEKVGKSQELSMKMQNLRQELDHAIQIHMHETQAIAVIESLTLGITQNLSWDILQIFNLSGTRHLLSISGSHIAMVAMFSYGIFFLCMRFVIIFFPRINAHTSAIVLSILVIGFYVSLSGMQVPTIRAFFMSLLALLAIFSNRYSAGMHRIIIAAIIVILLDNNVIYSPSFYLSFYAVFLIAFHQVYGVRGISKLKSYVRLNILLLLGLMPMSLYFFSQYSWITLLANLVAIPWVGFIILPLAIILQWLSWLGFSCVSFWYALEWMTRKFLWVLSFFSDLTLNIPGIFLTGHINFLYALVFSLITLLAFLSKGAPGRYLCVLAAIPLLFFNYHDPKTRHAQLIFLNVGQGLSILIKTQHHLLVYDTGPKFFTGGDVAQSVIMPYLYYQGWKNIDILMVSHGDADHSGGVDTLKKNVEIKRMMSSDLQRVPGATLCQRGQHWQWDGVNFDVLYPDTLHQHRGNNSSCVLKISIGKASALLVGDIEKISEKYLVENFSKTLSSTILSVPHHGSKSSSSDDFLTAVYPRYAVFSYGFLNRFHFPHPSVVHRYGQHEIETLATVGGPVFMEISSLGVTIKK